ncbi:hypothetical protein F1D05_09540 [Kribbella qitaiheensis]|uniref:Uncharacterized protein n=1 Tax=Kribbella qitaiheensis TaxID=1544730 RepID=A0A7G6WVR9_9ACTN|nr:hypothetical protein [Kribbella qitaiheensis]QNE18084.1 hypothetical protein F1D05_09540 [Kribbella qitaiheensis]
MTPADDVPTAAKAGNGKLTGADLEKQFTNWSVRRRDRRTERAAARTPEIRAQAARSGIAVMLGLALAATAVVSAVSRTAYEHQAAANAARIDALQNQTPGTATAPASPVKPVDATALATLSARASQAAREVADKQQDYAVLFRAVNNAPSAGNGSPSETVLKTVSHRKALARYWDPKSFVVEDSLAYAFTTTPYFGRDEIDPRFPWYVRYDGLKVSDPRSYSWTVESVMPTIDAPGTARVVWVNRNLHATVLAWASAVYTDSTRVFSRLDLVVTAAGGPHQYARSNAEADKSPELGQGMVHKP